MSVIPSPTTSRGEPVLQPAFFTSSLFVHPLRDDIFSLITVYTDRYALLQPQNEAQNQEETQNPFELFKEIWRAQGWVYLHFKVFDARSRESFLKQTGRLFLERTGEKDAPLTRVAALFGFYTFVQTQPEDAVPALFRLSRFPIPIDTYTSMINLPKLLTTESLQSLQPFVASILSTLAKQHAFQILPHSSLFPLNPRELPREIFVRDGTTNDLEPPAAKKKGRPTKRDKIKKSRDALAALDHLLQTDGDIRDASPSVTRERYRELKNVILDTLCSGDDHTYDDVLEHANEAVLVRLRKIEQMAAEKGLEIGGEGGERTGLGRVEKAAREMNDAVFGFGSGRRGGILGMLDGAGLE